MINPENIHNESRIAIDETDWIIKFGALQLAVEKDIDIWTSQNGEFRYILIPITDKDTAIPSYDTSKDVPATIPDPEFWSDDMVGINPGKWVVNKMYKEVFEKHVSITPNRVKGSTNRKVRPVLPFTSYIIDESKMSIEVVDCPKGLSGDTTTRVPNFKDIADLCNALDDLLVAVRM